MSTTVVVTAVGDTIIAGRMIGSTPTQAEPKFLGWGTGGAAGGPFTAAKTDVGAFQEAAESRVTCTSSQVTTTYTNDTYQAVGTITSSSGQTIAEVVLSDTSSKPFSTTWATAPTGTGGTSAVSAASYTPANGTYVQCRSEVMQVSAGSGTTNLTLVRAQNGSSAVAQSNGDQVTAGNVPGSSTVTNGNLFVHASFSGLPLSSGDSLASTVKISFN